MKTSYTNPLLIEINIDLGLGEIQTIIAALEKRAEAGENDFLSRELLRSLISTKAESVRQLRDNLKHYA
jgi:hypothetical protein